MAVYKVIQDVEAEDKLLGPLSFKAFVYAGITFVLGFINVRLAISGAPPVMKVTLILLFSGPMILFGVLASPLGREQPTEVWLLSRLRFFFKPRRRLWDQEGINELVTITAPKKEDRQLTKDLSPNEVQSRLKALASTLDTRGWAVKNVDVNLSSPDVNANVITPESDRLVGNAGVPQQMSVVDVHAADDILDEKNNPTAQKFEAMMKKAESERKHGLISRIKDMVENDEEPKKKESKSSKSSIATKAEKSKQEKEKEREQALLDEALKEVAQKRSVREKGTQAVKAKENAAQPRRVLSGEHIPEVEDKKEQPKDTSPPVTVTNQTVNMELAQSGSAFSVATLSKMANRPPVVQQTGPNEVTISLH